MDKEEVKKVVSDLTGVPMENLSSGYFPDENVYYASEKIRGGVTLLVDSDGEVLLVPPGLNFESHMQRYRQGERNERSQFTKMRERNSLRYASGWQKGK